MPKSLKGLVGDDDFVKGEKVLGVDLRGRHEQVIAHVASGKKSLLRELGRNDQRATDTPVKTRQRGDELLGLGILNLEGLNDQDISREDPGTQSLAESEFLDGAGGVLCVAPGVWPVNNTSAHPDRGTCIAGAGASGSLLFPRLFPGEIDGCLSLYGSSSAAAVCPHGYNNIVDGLGPLAIGNDVDIGLLGGLRSENGGALGLLGGFGLLDGGADHDKGSFGTGNRPADKDNPIGLANLNDP